MTFILCFYSLLNFFLVEIAPFFVTAGWMADVEGASAFHLANLYEAQYIHCERLDITFNVRQHFCCIYFFILVEFIKFTFIYLL